MKAIRWHDEAMGADYTEEDIPADLADQAAEYREALLDLAVEQDEAVMEAYLDGKEISEIGRAHV